MGEQQTSHGVRYEAGRRDVSTKRDGGREISEDLQGTKETVCLPAAALRTWTEFRESRPE